MKSCSSHLKLLTLACDILGTLTAHTFMSGGLKCCIFTSLSELVLALSVMGLHIAAGVV